MGWDPANQALKDEQDTTGIVVALGKEQVNV